MGYHYSGDDEVGCGYWLAVALVGLVILFCAHLYYQAQWVTDSDAMERIETMFPNAESVYILRDDGNTSPLIHDVSDVTFEIELHYRNPEDSDERRVVYTTVRCRDQLFADMVCREYGGGGDPFDD